MFGSEKGGEKTEQALEVIKHVLSRIEIIFRDVKDDFHTVVERLESIDDRLEALDKLEKIEDGLDEVTTGFPETPETYNIRDVVNRLWGLEKEVTKLVNAAENMGLDVCDHDEDSDFGDDREFQAFSETENVLKDEDDNTRPST